MSWVQDLRRARQIRRDGSVEHPAAVIARYVADPAFPYLVSFPRTGSHWLRMLMEVTFQKAALVRSFFEHDASSFTCMHHHDVDMDLRRSSVIYLHRDPVETTYSVLRYHDLDVYDPILVRYWSTRYALHLRKWLVDEDFTAQKTVITYAELRSAPQSAMEAIGEHLERSFDPERLNLALALVDKRRVDDRTRHDPQVVQRSGRYADERQRFQEEMGSLVREVVVANGVGAPDAGEP